MSHLHQAPPMLKLALQVVGGGSRPGRREQIQQSPNTKLTILSENVMHVIMSSFDAVSSDPPPHSAFGLVCLLTLFLNSSP